MRPAYPVPPRAEIVDDFHGELVADPFRPLEETDNEATRSWITAENTLTEQLLARVGTREDIRARLEQLWDYPKLGVPVERGGRLFQWRQDGLANQPVLYVMARANDVGKVLLDPNLASQDGTVAVTDMALSADGSLLAYATSTGGSDWRTWRVRSVEHGEDLPDVLSWSKFTGAAWRHDNSGFFYGVLDAPHTGNELTEESRHTRIAFHRLGTAQDDDAPIWSNPSEPEWLPDVEVSEDGRYLYLTIGHGTRPKNQLHVLDLAAPSAAFHTVVGDFETMAEVVGNEDETLLLLTDHGAERRRIVATSLADPRREQWREVVGENADTLLEAHYFGGRLVCHRLHDATSRLSVYSTRGSHLHDVFLERAGAVSAISGTYDSVQMYFSTTGYTDSGSVFRHDLGRSATELVHPPACPIDVDAFATTEVFVESLDGTRIPLFLTHRKDVVPTGEVATLLCGYGGFNVAMTPRFSVSMALFAERGGLVAVACLRGGGEYGKSWYEAGRLAHKQNVFDDFCACARHLVSSGWTRAEKIAMNGGSNGGLLVGACLTQHPELFGAAVPEVGVLDMLRFHRFTIGWAWTSDYGDPEDPRQYAWVRAYSPLHNLEPGRAYPATLVTTGDHDDRVVPAHSFKFAAALQAAQGGAAPILVRIETAAGHGMGKPTAKLIAERTDVLAFIEAALGDGFVGWCE